MDLRDLHKRLLFRYRQLSDSRQSGRVFLIEHDLDIADLRALQGRVREQLREHPWDDERHWRGRELPLLVLATERGYRYDGYSYWDHLEDHLKIEITPRLRCAMSAHFDRQTAWSGVLRPDTPWALHFRHIAWPITHAVLPVALHQPLFKAITACDTPVRADSPPGDFLGSLRDFAESARDGRLQVFLGDAEVAADVVKAFLVDGYDPVSLSESALKRFKRDLEGNRSARREVRHARRRQHELDADLRHGSRARTSRDRSTTPRLELSCTLVLRDASTRPALYLDPPTLRDGIAARIRHSRRARRYPLRLFGGGQRVSLRDIFGGVSVPVRDDLPTPKGEGRVPVFGEDPLDADKLGDKQLALALEQVAVDLSYPLLFAESHGEGGDARQIVSRDLWRGGIYYALVRDEDVPEPPPDGLSQRGVIGAMRCLRIDTGRKGARAWLERRGVETWHRAVVRHVGHPPFGARRGIDSGVCPRDTIALSVRGAPVETAQGQRMTEGLWRLELPEVPKQERLALATDGSTLEEIDVETREAREVPPPLVRLSLDERARTKEALRTRAMTLRIDADLELPDLDCVLEVSRGHRTIARAFTRLMEPPPVSIRRTHPVWEQLAGALSDSAEGFDDQSVHLTASVGALAVDSWRLDPAAVGVWWHLDESGTARLITDHEDSDAAESTRRVLVYEQDEPMRSVEGADPDGPASTFRLLQPCDVDGRPLLGSGLCQGPRRFDHGALSVRRPRRLLRRWRSSPGIEGEPLSTVLEAWRSWHLASSTDFLAENRRRQVAALLLGWVVEILCGRRWAEAEAELRLESPTGSPSAAFEDLLRRRDQLVDEYTEDKLLERRGRCDDPVRRVRIELARALGDIGPQMREFVGREWPDGEQEEQEEFVRRINDELIAAYSAAVRRVDPAFPEEELPDVYVPGDHLRKCWEEAEAETRELRPLAELVYPPKRAEELVSLDYRGLGEAGLIERLHRWIEQRNKTPLKWADEEVASVTRVWTRPETVRFGSEQAVIALEKALLDRFAARAIRYAALRWQRDVDQEMG